MSARVKSGRIALVEFVRSGGVSGHGAVKRVRERSRRRSGQQPRRPCRTICKSCSWPLGREFHSPGERFPFCPHRIRTTDQPQQCLLWVISGHRPTDQGCPLCPRKQTCSASKSMSALCRRRTSVRAIQNNFSLSRFDSLDKGARRLCHRMVF
jgi:hypothetical protein